MLYWVGTSFDGTKYILTFQIAESPIVLPLYLALNKNRAPTPNNTQKSNLKTCKGALMK